MADKKITKLERAVIKSWAKKIQEKIDEGKFKAPIYWCVEYKYVTGAEMLKGGEKWLEGEEAWEGEIPQGGWDPTETYKLSRPVANAINIKRRLLALWKRGGVQACQDWIEEISQGTIILGKANQNPKAVHMGAKTMTVKKPINKKRDE
jgi:hypothetical protein